MPVLLTLVDEPARGTDAPLPVPIRLRSQIVDELEAAIQGDGSSHFRAHTLVRQRSNERSLLLPLGALNGGMLGEGPIDADQLGGSGPDGGNGLGGGSVLDGGNGLGGGSVLDGGSKDGSGIVLDGGSALGGGSRLYSGRGLDVADGRGLGTSLDEVISPGEMSDARAKAEVPDEASAEALSDDPNVAEVPEREPEAAVEQEDEVVPRVLGWVDRQSEAAQQIEGALPAGGADANEAEVEEAVSKEDGTGAGKRTDDLRSASLDARIARGRGRAVGRFRVPIIDSDSD